MPARPVLFDTTRLLTRISHPAPTGIDRVDLAYARRFLPPAGDGDAVAITPFGARRMPESRWESLLTALETSWRDETAADTDQELKRVLAWLGGEQPRAPRVRRKSSPLRRLISQRRWTAGAFSWGRAADAPPGAVYLHTSHLRLDRPDLFAWLDERPDIRPVFFVHDLIPIEFPEYGVPGEARRHRTRLDTIAARAAGILVNSEHVGDSLTRHLSDAGRRIPPLRVAPLGVEAAFETAPAPAPARRPYFLIVSTIEARKNHLLLLQLWRDLAARLGPRTPALVIVGRRGWESESAVDLLDRCEAIRPHVAEVSGLSTAGLASLMAGARALLMPSFAEGYGIPVVEALSLGTPVIASSIDVHREIAKGRATLIHPLDGLGWRDAIEAAAEAPGRRDAPTAFKPPTWADHFSAVESLLGAV